jgi:hypothetical protein
MIERVRLSTPALKLPPRRRVRQSDITLLDAIHDPGLFAPWFSKSPGSWQAWFVVIAAIFGLPMTKEQLALFRKVSGRKEPPHEIATEVWLICGRRAGKSFILALIAVYLACFHSYAEYLAPGERGTVMIVASDRRQARVILRYISALLKKVPLLAKLITREWAEGFDLVNGITIEIASASFRSVRGYTIVAGLFDEIAFFASDEGSASPDHEILNAVRPAMATIPNALLLCASSPYARRGALFDAHRLHHAKEHDPVLVIQADTRTLNPSVPQSFIDAEYEKDPASASAEFGAQFRSDIEAFISLDTIMACVSDGIHERAPAVGVTYSAFIDPAGGSGKDSFTLAIGHKDKATDLSVLDVIRESKPPFSPEIIVESYAKLLKSYGVTKILGDRYAGEWAREPFKKLGIDYDPAAAPKSDLYRDALPLINSKKADLLDHRKMIQQFVGLERRTARSGKDSIDHAPNSHDDLCNVVAGLLVNIGVRKYRYDTTLAWVAGDDDASEAEDFRAGRLTRYMMNGGYFR